MSDSINPTQDELQEVLENLYDAQDSIKGTGTDPARSRSAQIRKAREFIQAHTQQAVREARREARIDEINMALGIEELWVSPATKRQAYYEKRLKELQENKQP